MILESTKKCRSTLCWKTKSTFQTSKQVFTFSYADRQASELEFSTQKLGRRHKYITRDRAS